MCILVIEFAAHHLLRCGCARLPAVALFHRRPPPLHLSHNLACVCLVESPERSEAAAAVAAVAAAVTAEAASQREGKQPCERA